MCGTGKKIINTKFILRTLNLGRELGTRIEDVQGLIIKPDGTKIISISYHFYRLDIWETSIISNF